MGRRTRTRIEVSRRRLLAVTGTVSAALVAGCSGDGGDGTDTQTDGGGGDETESTATATATATATPTATPTAMPTPTATSTVPASTSSAVDELTIVDTRPRIGYFGEEEQTYYPVEVTVQNDGDQQTNVQNYDYDVVAYDADDNDVSGSQGGSSGGENTDAPPGGTGSLVVYTTITVEPDAVARYEVSLDCEGAVSRAEGVYCQ